MRKLSKLTLKELETSMDIIETHQLSEITGGTNYNPFGTYNFYMSYIESQFKGCYQSIINSIESAIDPVGSYFETRQEAFSNLSWSAVEEAVTIWLNNVAGGTSPIGAPIIIIDNIDLWLPPGSYSGSQL